MNLLPYLIVFYFLCTLYLGLDVLNFGRKEREKRVSSEELARKNAQPQ